MRRRRGGGGSGRHVVFLRAGEIDHILRLGRGLRRGRVCDDLELEVTLWLPLNLRLGPDPPLQAHLVARLQLPLLAGAEQCWLPGIELDADALLSAVVEVGAINYDGAGRVIFRHTAGVGLGAGDATCGYFACHVPAANLRTCNEAILDERPVEDDAMWRDRNRRRIAWNEDVAVSGDWAQAVEHWRADGATSNASRLGRAPGPSVVQHIGL